MIKFLHLFKMSQEKQIISFFMYIQKMFFSLSFFSQVRKKNIQYMKIVVF